ncbi:hypothetical protein [Mycolicibacterium sp. 050158]|jgi:hypothetical protein|uniref:hypothetical protein n=1 Tax=Mycolicibacterium sp. 050158 TaxID=3090602 RepID=UPI00299E3280|nr:hypothetical protein [Mycolicibacterium sp. 050158]MDX1892331.1 hypothetical protein [Mycolicibacterium sp. 050158]
MRSIGIVSSVAMLAGLALVGAPEAAADCNDSSGTVVCAQGDIRGTHGAPPVRSSLGSYGTWCSSSACFTGGGFGIVLGP